MAHKISLFVLSTALFLTAAFSASAQYRPSRIELDHGYFYDEAGALIPDAGMRTLIGDEIFEETYLGATQQFRVGKNLLTGGAVAFGLGLGGLIATAVTYQEDYAYSDWEENRFVAGFYLSLLTMIGGGVAVDVAIPLMIIGAQRLSWIEREYNAGRSYSLSFRQTRNGMGLVLEF